MRKVATALLVTLVWLLGFVTAKVFASTMVTSEGAIVERHYKPSYLVKNNVVLADIHETKTKLSSRRSGLKAQSHPGSHIKTYKLVNTVMGVAA